MTCFADCRTRFLVAFVAASVSGCAPEAHRLVQTFSHPGPAGRQRAEAIQHDPYLLDDVGPEVVGARPREYQRPLNEVERARLAASPPAGLPVAPPVGMPLAPAPVTGPAYPFGPAPAVAPYPPAPASIVTTPAPQAPPFQYQQRAPY